MGKRQPAVEILLTLLMDLPVMGIDLSGNFTDV
jgi:hypothetical protein